MMEIFIGTLIPVGFAALGFFLKKFIGAEIKANTASFSELFEKRISHFEKEIVVTISELDQKHQRLEESLEHDERSFINRCNEITGRVERCEDKIFGIVRNGAKK